MSVLGFVLYAAIGLGAAAARAYYEPTLARRYYDEHGWKIIYDEQTSTTFDYPFVLVVYACFWPIALAVLVIGEALNSVRQRGLLAMRQAAERDRLAVADAEAIDRIIREANL